MDLLGSLAPEEWAKYAITAVITILTALVIDAIRSRMKEKQPRWFITPRIALVKNIPASIMLRSMRLEIEGSTEDISASDNLSVSYVFFWNSGKEKISREDMNSEEPPRIVGKPGVRILHVNRINGKWTDDPQCVDVGKRSQNGWDIQVKRLEYREGNVFEVIHVGKPEPSAPPAARKHSFIRLDEVDPAEVYLALENGIKMNNITKRTVGDAVKRLGKDSDLPEPPFGFLVLAIFIGSVSIPATLGYLLKPNMFESWGALAAFLGYLGFDFLVYLTLKLYFHHSMGWFGMPEGFRSFLYNRKKLINN